MYSSPSAGCWVESAVHKPLTPQDKTATSEAKKWSAKNYGFSNGHLKLALKVSQSLL